MRTVRVTITNKLDATSEVKLETEVILADDEDATDAGRDAWRVIQAVSAGMVEEVE